MIAVPVASLAQQGGSLLPQRMLEVGGAGRPSAWSTAAGAAQVRVTAVLDGDTIRVETLDGRQLGRVRLLGIDAPELAHPPEPAECYAEDATDILERLAPIGSTIELVTDTAHPSRDRYDRLLRYVGHDDVDVAHELLASGAARRYEADQALAREDSYSAALDDAHDAQRGLWGNC